MSLWSSWWGAWQQIGKHIVAVVTESFTPWSTGRKQRYWECYSFWNLKVHPQWCAFPSKATYPNPSQSNSTSWGPRIQIWKPIGAILIQTPTASVEYEILKGNVANHMPRNINSSKRIKFTGVTFHLLHGRLCKRPLGKQTDQLLQANWNTEVYEDDTKGGSIKVKMKKLESKSEMWTWKTSVFLMGFEDMYFKGKQRFKRVEQNLIM